MSDVSVKGLERRTLRPLDTVVRIPARAASTRGPLDLYPSVVEALATAWRNRRDFYRIAAGRDATERGRATGARI